AIGDPVIMLSATALSFTGNIGTGSPDLQTVTISNGGAGTLTGLSAAVTYSGGASNWLQANLSGPVASPTATLTVQPFIGALTPGTYAATITVSSSAARTTSKAIAVSFTVVGGPQLLTIVRNNSEDGVVEAEQVQGTQVFGTTIRCEFLAA